MGSLGGVVAHLRIARQVCVCKFVIFEPYEFHHIANSWFETGVWCKVSNLKDDGLTRVLVLKMNFAPITVAGAERIDQADSQGNTTQGTTASVHSHNVCRPAYESGLVWFWFDWNCFYKFTLRSTNYFGMAIPKDIQISPCCAARKNSRSCNENCNNEISHD